LDGSLIRTGHRHCRNVGFKMTSKIFGQRRTSVVGTGCRQAAYLGSASKRPAGGRHLYWVVEALLIVLPYPGIMSDLSTQRLSKQ
jgi:hypothetical protein